MFLKGRMDIVLTKRSIISTRNVMGFNMSLFMYQKVYRIYCFLRWPNPPIRARTLTSRVQYQGGRPAPSGEPEKPLCARRSHSHFYWYWVMGWELPRLRVDLYLHQMMRVDGEYVFFVCIYLLVYFSNPVINKQ